MIVPDRPAARVVIPHFRALDGLRGVAAYMVVLFHFWASTSLITSLPVVRHAYLFVDFFFVLSGFVIAANYRHRITGPKSFGDFVVLRLCRIYPLHVFMLAVFVLWFLLRHSQVPDVGVVVGNLFLLQSVGVFQTLYLNFPSWSISAEFYTYMVFGVLALTVRSAAALWWSALALAAAGLAVVAAFSPDAMDATFDLGLFRCIAGFFAGVLIQRVYLGLAARRPPGKPRTGLWTALELGAVVAVILLVDASPIGSRVALLAPAVFAFAVLVFAFEGGAVSRLLNTGPVQFVGLRSYSVYMVHAFAILLVEEISRFSVALTGVNPQHGPQLLSDAFVLFYCAVVLLISVGTYRWIEEPGRLLGRRLVRPRERIPTLAAMPPPASPQRLP